MKRRFNSTGRKKLDLECVSIRIQEGRFPGSASSFTAEIKLPGSLQLDPQAKIYVEPYVRTSSMRFPFGTVSAITAPADTLLVDIDAGADVLFRLRIVDEAAEVGKILAAVDEIRPRRDADDADGRRSLLPLESVDLGEQIWRVSLIGSARPTLQINNKIPGLREQLLEDPLLKGAIYPQALRSVISHIGLENPGDDETPWIADWKKFTEELLGRPWPIDLDSDDDGLVLMDFVDEIIERYSQHFKFASAAQLNHVETKS